MAPPTGGYSPRPGGPLDCLVSNRYNPSAGCRPPISLSSMIENRRCRTLCLLMELALVAALAMAARLWFMAVTQVTYEDAFISLRYARNLSEGLGLVYN